MGKPLVIIIAAMSENRVIGRNNAIPWSIREDMQHFRELTMGFPCVMGRLTWESLPRKPLPGRLNIVVSRSALFDGAGAAAVRSLDEALRRCGDHEKVFICGGSSLYREAMPLAGRMEITLIHSSCEGDAFFPEIDPRVWTQDNVSDCGGFSFISFSRKGS